MGPAAKTYVEYEGRVSRDYPKFLAIAMLPCHMLWPWIANQLIDFVAKSNPYYKGWFKENETAPNHKGHLEKFVDSHFGPKEKKKALTIFRDGMINELNFFQDACLEKLIWLPRRFCLSDFKLHFYEFIYVVVLQSNDTTVWIPNASLFN